jgi:uncharacterized protein YcsI (UPF0317 family)
MLIRKVLLTLGIPLAFAFTACSKKAEVTISPTKYVVGAVVSDIATPAVDEVVRLKPSEVLIHTCTATPPARVMQFNTELDARLSTTKTMSFTAQGC